MEQSWQLVGNRAPHHWLLTHPTYCIHHITPLSLYSLTKTTINIHIYILHTALQAMPKMYFKVLLILILSDPGIFTGTTVTRDHIWIWA